MNIRKIKKIVSVLLVFALVCLTALFTLASCEEKTGGDTGKTDANGGENGENGEDAGPQPQSFLKEAATGQRNNYGGSVGYEFECLADMTVSAVGRPLNGEMNQSHTIRIWEVESQALLASATVTPESPLDSLGFKTAQLATPITLKAGTVYRIVSAEEKDGDMWYDFGTKADEFPDLKPGGDCRIITPAFSAEGAEGQAEYPAFEYLPEGAVNKGYVGVTFYYVLN